MGNYNIILMIRLACKSTFVLAENLQCKWSIATVTNYIYSVCAT